MGGATIIREADQDKVIDVTIYGASRLHSENLPSCTWRIPKRGGSSGSCFRG